MTRLEALKAMVEAVEADQLPTFPVTIKAIGDEVHSAEYAFEGSLDAAQALHEAVLPGVPWWVEIRTDDQAEAGIFLGDAGRIITARHDGNSPARAWLLAILRALIAQDESK